MNIVLAGDCGFDRYFPANRDFPGGISYNVAMHAREQFSQEDTIQLLSVLGDDSIAENLHLNLGLKGVQTHIQTLPGKSPIQDIYLPDSGEREFGNYAIGVLENFRIPSSAKMLINDSDVLVVPWFEQITPLFESVMHTPSHGLRVVDFADIAENPDIQRVEKWLEHFDIGFFGLLPKDASLIDALAALSKKHQKLFIVTLAEHGSLAFNCGLKYQCPAMEVKRVVDTTGAGDSYAAGFLSEYCSTNNIQEAMHKGAILAASTIVHLGATPLLNHSNAPTNVCKTGIL